MKFKDSLKKGIALTLCTLMIAGLLAGCNKGGTTPSGVTSVDTEEKLPTKTADEVLTDTIDVSVADYTLVEEEIMYLAGVKQSAYTNNVEYTLTDMNEDSISELLLKVKEDSKETVGVYTYNSENQNAKLICEYEEGVKGFIKEPEAAYKDMITGFLADVPGELIWVEGTQWADSSIFGVHQNISDPGPKNDYYFSSNYGWLSETHVKYQGDCVEESFVSDVVRERRTAMFEDRSKYNGKDIQILRDYYDVATDWEKRNEEGIEPVKKYLDAIEEIDSLSEMTEYLSDPEKDPFVRFFNMTVSLDVKNTSAWILQIDGDDFSVLSRYYHNNNPEDIEALREDFEIPVKALLSRAGYSDKEVEKIIEESYEIENKLLEKDWAPEEEKESIFDGYLPFDEFTSKCENFPLKEILNSYGVTKGNICATYPEYVEYLDEMYTEDNLSKLKSYLLVHTAYQTYNRLDADMKNVFGEFETVEDLMEDSKNDYQSEALGYRGLFSVAEENAYMTFFVDDEKRQEIIDMCEDIRAAYRSILENEEWLSEEGKTAAIAKLDNMSFSVLRPDTLIDSSYLAVDKDASFLDAYAKIIVNKNKHNLSFVGKDRVKGDWRYDLRTEIATTVNNAFYYGSFNQFFILDGGVGKDSFNEDMTYEEKLGKLGAVIGHELTHGFDPLGIQYDKDGNMVVTDDNPYGWLPKEDYEAFMAKADRIAEFYNGMKPYPYSSIDGNKLWGEAAADIGGVTIGLKIAESREDFDYDKFFHAFSRLWMTQTTLIREQGEITDEHPLRYLRVNSVLCQFDKFNEIYRIEEGDLMYLAPENRIKIW